MLSKLVLQARRARVDVYRTFYPVRNTKSLTMPDRALPDDFGCWLEAQGAYVFYPHEILRTLGRYRIVGRPTCPHEVIEPVIYCYEATDSGWLYPVFRILVDCQRDECQIPF